MAPLTAIGDPYIVFVVVDHTQLLLDVTRGDDRARERMLPVVYDELRRLARRYLARERRDHTLRPTALVHEAYLRSIDQRRVDWNNRAQFPGIAAAMMRRILMNPARDRAADKRGGGAQRVTLRAADDAFEHRDLDVVALDDALPETPTHPSRPAVSCFLFPVSCFLLLFLLSGHIC